MKPHTGGSPARKLLVLDLDETLIHGCPEAAGFDFLAAGIPAFIRPGARDFLMKMADFYELAVWTSASSDYAADIVRELFSSPPQFVWCRERCVRRLNPETLEVEFLKDLKKLRRLGWDLASVLAVDDSPEKFSRNYGNLVRVPPYAGGMDDVLELLAGYLATLSEEVLPEKKWVFELKERTGLMGAVRPQTPHRSPRQAFGGNRGE